jgi:hypothetical protein
MSDNTSNSSHLYRKDDVLLTEYYLDAYQRVVYCVQVVKKVYWSRKNFDIAIIPRNAIHNIQMPATWTSRENQIKLIMRKIT